MRGQWKGPHIFSPEVDNTPEREEGYLGYQPIGRSLRKLDFSKPLFYNPPTPNKLNTPHVNDPNPQYLPSSHLHYVRLVYIYIYILYIGRVKKRKKRNKAQIKRIM